MTKVLDWQLVNKKERREQLDSPGRPAINDVQRKRGRAGARVPAGSHRCLTNNRTGLCGRECGDPANSASYRLDESSVRDQDKAEEPVSVLWAIGTQAVGGWMPTRPGVRMNR